MNTLIKKSKLIYRVGTVHPELLKDECLYEAELQARLPLRVAFLGLLAWADKQGCFHWDPQALKAKILPFDEVDMSQVLEALVACGFIKKYEQDAKLYGRIAHQDDAPGPTSIP